MKKYIRLFIYFILFVVLIGAFVYLGKKDFSNSNNQSDAEKFAVEYNVDKVNPFKYVYGSEAVDIIKNKTGIIYLGFSSNDWSKYYVKYLTDVLKNNNVKEAYYYDILKDRTKYTKYYRELENMLSDFLYEMDTGKIHISTPALVIVKDGQILFYDDETSVERNNITPDYYWNQNRIENFKSRIDSYIKEVGLNE